MRRLVEDGIQNLHELFSEESPAAKQELNKHLSAVRMFPLEDGEGWYYVAEGTWELLGADPLAPDMRVREEGRIADNPPGIDQKGHSPKTSSIGLCLPCISAAAVWAGVKCPCGISCASARKKLAIASTVMAWRKSAGETL